MAKLINNFNKTKLKKIASYLESNIEEKMSLLTDLFDWMDLHNFYSGNAQIEYRECYSINIYYKDINLFTLSIWKDYIRIDGPRRNQAGTISIKKIPLIDSILRDKLLIDTTQYFYYFKSNITANRSNLHTFDKLINILKEVIADIEFYLKEHLHNEFSVNPLFQIETIDIENYKLFERVEIKNLSSQFNLFIGENGQGKTCILDAMFHCLSAFQYMFREAKNFNKNKIEAKNDIHQKPLMESGHLTVKYSKHTKLSQKINFNSNEFDITRSKTIHGTNVSESENNLLKDYVKQIELSTDFGFCNPVLPIIAYFTTDRLLSKETLAKSDVSSIYSVYSDSKRSRNNISKVKDWMIDRFIDQERYEKSFADFRAVKEALEKAYDLLFYDELNGDKLNQTCIRYYRKSMVLESNDKIFSLDQMSDGYQSIFGIVADLAYRITMLNPYLGERALQETPGVVLIDEIDLHLHPKWQKKIINVLTEIFPKIQFIATTHSPFIVQAIDPKNHRLFYLNQAQVQVLQLNEYYGLEDAAYELMKINDIQWSEYRRKEFISYKDFTQLLQSYNESNTSKKKVIMNQLEIALKQNSSSLELYEKMKSKLDLLKLLD